MTLFTRIARTTLAMFLLFTLSSCTIKLTYKFLDNILGWQISQYVTLVGTQKKQANAALDTFHDWHRQTQLSLYAAYLEELKTGLLQKPVTPDYLHTESNKLQDMLDVSMNQLLPDIAHIAATLNEEQIQEVVQNLEKDRAEYQEDYIDAKPKDVQKRRIRDITRYIGGFFGKFTEEQEARLTSWEDSLEKHEVLMMSQQQDWEADFLAAMQYQNNLPVLQDKLRALMLYRTDNWDEELQRKLDINQDLTFEMLADLFNSQTPKQEKKMERKFDQYIEDLKQLARKSSDN